MTQHLHLRIHISEPWNFESFTGVNELGGWTVDHEDPTAEEWEVTLNYGFDYHERRYARLLIGPRYVGEHLSRLFDAVVGFPVRIAHKTHDGGWHFAFAGTVEIDREKQAKQKHEGHDEGGPDAANPQGDGN